MNGPDPSIHFEHCPRCGASTASSDRVNPFHCRACGFLLYFNAASAVAAFVVREDGKVLYLRRSRDPARGRLGMPGGFVDIGETAEAALRREVLEEVGVEIATVRYLASFPNRYMYSGVQYNTLDFFFVTSAIDLAPLRALDSVESLLWCDPRAVDHSEIAFESMRLALSAYLATTPRSNS